MARPTIHDVAEAAGVSVTSVSHALNGKGRMTPDTRAHIRATAEGLGYRAHRHARALRKAEALSIGLITTYPADSDVDRDSRMDWYMLTALAAASEALKQDCALVLIPPLDQLSWAGSLPIDGVLVIDSDPAGELVAVLQSYRLCVVVIAGSVSAIDVPSVTLDIVKTVELVMEHLQAVGVRRPGFVTEDVDRSSTVSGKDAYTQWCSGHGIEPVVVVVPEGADRIGAGVQACTDLLRQQPEVDGLYVPVDSVAAGCLEAAARAGRSVGQDFHVVTSDGKVARESIPPMSAIDTQREVLAAAAATMLISELRSGEPAPSRIFDPKLIDRSHR